MLSRTVKDTIIEYVSEKNVLFDEDLSKHTSFKIGGPADAFVEIENTEQLTKVSEYLDRVEEKYYILGNGSNTLFSDRGFEGVILHIGGGFSEITVSGTRIIAKAGAALAKVSKTAQEHSLTGLEFAAGIPGTVGGGVVMNAGAYGGEMSFVVDTVKAISPRGEEIELENKSLEFGYRYSILRHRGYVVTEVSFNLKEGDKDEIRAKMDDFNSRRREKQPLEYPSAGSVFKRPEGHFAGQLIMEAGMRGFQIGGARVSDKHCGFIINTGHASAEDVTELIDEIQFRVRDRFGVDLEPEIEIVK